MTTSQFVNRALGYLKRRTKRVLRHTSEPSLISAQTLSDEAFLGLFKINRVSSQLAAGNLAGAKAALLAHFAQRGDTAAWPQPPSMLTDLRLELSNLNRDSLLQRANTILDNDLFADGIKPKMMPTGTIDWLSHPTADQQWLWRLNRHQWWVVWALAYQQTRDERFVRAFVHQMTDWVTQNPLIPQKNEKSTPWRLMETGLRLRISWVTAFNLFYDAPSFTGAAKLLMLRAIYDHAQLLYQFKTNRNHLLRESNGLAFISAYFPEFAEAEVWLEAALTRIDRELLEQINEDGSQIEASTGYQWLVVDEFEKAYELLQAHQLALPHHHLGNWLEKMVRVLAYVIRPDGTFPEINDGFILWPQARIAWLGWLLKGDDLVYIGTGGIDGEMPSVKSRDFPDAGLFVMRSDWTREARYLLFDAGPYGGPHGHEDKLSLEVCAFGQPFIVDSGSYTYNKADPYRLYFVGSQGHNTILVDGLSQVRRWNRANLHPKTCRGNYATWVSRPAFDYVEADYDEGYGSFSLQQPANANLISDVKHTRKILFVKPDYWLIVDELQADKSHNYQLLFHTSPNMQVATANDNRVILAPQTGRPGLLIIPANSDAASVTCMRGSEDPIQGWISLEHRHKAPATTIIYEYPDQASVTMATLLYPYQSGKTPDKISLEPVVLRQGNGQAFRVNTEQGQDLLMLSDDDSPKQFDSFELSGRIGGIRLDTNGDIVTQFESLE